MHTPSLRLSLLLLATGVALGGCQGGDPPPASPPIVLVQTAADSPGQGAAYTGEIRARHEVDLAFRVGGKIADRLVDVGSDIRPGQALARLDPTDLQLAASGARAQFAAAESEVATTRAERERYAGLLAKKFVSQAAFEAKDNAFNSATARLEQARAQNRISGNQAAYGTLSSDKAAVVTAVLADAGQVVSPGQPVLRIARPEEKEVAIAVPENRIAELRAARNIQVSLWAEPGTTLRGELRELSPVADPTTRTYAARIRLLTPPPEVQLGMTARVFLKNHPRNDYLLPLSAVLDVGQGPFVRLVTDGKVISRPVTIAAFREDGAVVSRGLTGGEAVIVSGAGKLADGQAVQTRAVTPPSRQR